MHAKGVYLSCPQSNTTSGVGFVWGCLNVFVCLCSDSVSKKHHSQVPASNINVEQSRTRNLHLHLHLLKFVFAFASY